MKGSSIYFISWDRLHSSEKSHNTTLLFQVSFFFFFFKFSRSPFSFTSTLQVSPNYIFSGMVGIQRLQLICLHSYPTPETNCMPLASCSTSLNPHYFVGIVMGWIVSPPNSYVEALTPNTSECNCV